MTTFDNCTRNNTINKNDKVHTTPMMPNTIDANDAHESNVGTCSSINGNGQQRSLRLTETLLKMHITMPLQYTTGIAGSFPLPFLAARH